MERRLSANETVLEQLDHAINGNGRPGLMAEVNNYMSEQRGAWKALLRVGGLIAFVIMGMLAWLTYRDSERKTQLRPPQTSLVQPKQDAANPPY